MSKYHLIAAPLFLFATAAMAQSSETAEAEKADTTRIEFSTGADYIVGSYGAASDTKVWIVPVEAKLQKGKFRLAASVPYVSVQGPGRVVGGVVVFDPNSTTPVKNSGIGDVAISSGYLLNRQGAILPAFELAGSVKVPTASESIGTGKPDYALQLNGFKSIGSGTLLFGSIGYSWLGSPTAYRLNNGISASAGLNFKPGARTDMGATIAYREPVATGLDPQAIASPYITHRFSNGIGLTFYGVAGFTDSSPRAGAGLRLSIVK